MMMLRRCCCSRVVLVFSSFLRLAKVTNILRNSLMELHKLSGTLLRGVRRCVDQAEAHNLK